MVALFSAFSLATGLAFVAPASADDRDEAAPTILPGPVSSEAPRSDDAYPEADLLTLPVVDDQMQQDAVMMAERLEGHDRLASVGISLDRSTIEVYWYGEEQTDLNRVLDEVSSPVALRSSTYSPKELREASRALLDGTAGVDVAGVALRADGSGLEVTLSPSAGPAARSAVAAKQDAVSRVAGVPVEFEEMPTALQSRQSDTYHFAGARIHKFSNNQITSRCTSNFAAIRPSENNKKYLLTAAHCANVGDTWVVHDGVAGSNSYYMLGNTVSRNELYDVATIDSTTSFPFMWTGAWNSSTYTEINGLTSPVVGTEICYSGSYTGLVCGNIVTSPEANRPVNLGGGVIQTVYGYRTEQANQQISAGEGDSGGPGYVLTNTASGLKRNAATIISAGTSIPGATCPGDPSASNRGCGYSIITTSVAKALTSQNLALQIIP
ncbi:hypothetical protein [Cellulosimicrobium composti]|uniref:Peptidase S1 domain-containing protein n=1 Tax=Cellulosimicrobium composti TaxID=2672572 RepID=A0ABX0BM29_9MICO|nr:hypothetical protein [Cellulosimicrobium composti]NDO91446.1 hypothetical protein [Cellulosimicrobium composti]